MNMHIGIALSAPEGLGSLCPGMTYHLLSNSPLSPHCTLVFFSKCGSEWRADAIRINKPDFECALLQGTLIPNTNQPSLPPWLASIEGMCLDDLEDRRVTRKQSYRARAEARYVQIAALIANEQMIELSDDPKAKVRALTSASNVHPRRAFLWFCAYLCFGRSLLALVPAHKNAGFWDRAQKPADHKFGRPASLGVRTGHSAVHLSQRIADAWVKRAMPGKAMAQTYRESLRLDFGCRVMTGDDGVKRLYHPENSPFPSYNQFRYWVNKAFGREAVKQATVGRARYRTAYAASKGRYSESVANLYEMTEADAYYLKERPRQLLSREPGPRLAVCRIVDVVSSQILGVGFALGSENAEAYRSAKFCAAVGKRYFCLMVFGIEIEEGGWPGKGLPPSIVNDRGPGASERVDESSPDHPIISNLAPSYSGQSKATVESSHPRDARQDGQPSYQISSLNYYELARREVMRAVADNESSDVSSKLTPDMVRASVRSSPNGIYEYLAQRGRTSAIPKSLEDAIREYLKPVNMRLSSDGLTYDGFQYDVRHLIESGAVPTLRKGQSIEVKAYVYPLSARTIWLEVNGAIHDAALMLPIRDDEAQLNLSLHEMRELAESQRAMARRMHEHRTAAVVELEQSHLDVCGVEWNSGTRRIGQPGRGRKAG